MAGFVDGDLLRRMTAIIDHRGPDDHGVYLSPDGSVGLGNCRLSIIDLSVAGHMPMTNEDESIWLSYNGEIYNFLELRQELLELGHRFKSKTDSEVIIHGFEEWGMGLVSRLNGMFAFALLDLRPSIVGNNPKLYLVRDRFGIKPLYYTFQENRLLFGSEIKSILLAHWVPREVNLEALHRYLAFLWVPGPETMFQGIFKLPPGHYLEWQRDSYTIQQYWDLQFSPSGVRNKSELTKDLRTILTDSVRRHLISDVPLGVFLSGGIDSSCILALATEITRAPVTAYTIAFSAEDGRLEQAPDDAKYARLVARHFGADYHEIEVSPDIVNLLEKTVWHLDEPVADPAAIATYLICQAARTRSKVLLSGQGADEIFAGYRVHQTNRLANLFRLMPKNLRNGGISRILQTLLTWKESIPGVHPGLIMAVHRYFNKLLKGADLPPDERYVFYRSYYSEASLFGLYTRELQEKLSNCVVGAKHLAYFEKVAGEDFINQMLYVDVNTFLPELNLTYCDKLSSASSMETRVPFLDLELVEFMSRVPPSLKLKGLTNSKYILRRAMDGLLPDAVIHRRKAGFGAPIRRWLRQDLQGMVDDLLSPSRLRARGFFDPAAIRKLIEDDRSGVEDNSYRIWALLTLEVWMGLFIDNRVPAGIFPGN